MQNTDDLRIQSIRPLISPAILMDEAPMSEAATATVARARRDADNILAGKDDRLLIVVGPCSIHDPAAALDYASRLKPVADALQDRLLVLMRVYFEKPRTTVGWKGLINDPSLDGTFQINCGLRTARRLLLDLASRGIPAGTEFLDTIIPQFIADVISWGAIGARTTESQVHRELASGLSMPVGFKNGTDGNVQIAIDAVGAARQPHHFLSVTKQGIAAIVQTRGNESCHLILRGAKSGPNYQSERIRQVVDQLAKAGLPTRVMVDCSHGNSSKDPKLQIAVAQDVARQISEGATTISGVMLESHLVEGRQDLKSNVTPIYGQSITDACLAWEETRPVLEVLADAVRRRRAG